MHDPPDYRQDLWGQQADTIGREAADKTDHCRRRKDNTVWQVRYDFLHRPQVTTAGLDIMQLHCVGGAL